MIGNQKASVTVEEKPRFFGKADWVCFSITSLILFAVYLLCLPPNIHLNGDAGMFVTSAMYPGPTIPPGHPLWTLYGWVFIKLIPFSSIAWRIGVASSVAASLTGGLIALLVSRVGVLALSPSTAFQLLTLRDQKISALVCGTVAGLGLGFSTSFWSTALATTPDSFNLLLFTVTLTLVSNWFFNSKNKYLLVLAFFTGALAILENTNLISSLLGLWILVVIVERNLSRDVLLCTGTLMWWMLWSSRGFSIPPISQFVYAYMPLFWIVALVISLAGLFLCWKTRKIFSEWRILLLAGICFLGVLGLNFLLPIYSMTVPPIDWNHPRTVEGFFHMQYRGCYGCGHQAVFNPEELTRQAGQYLIHAGNDYGFLYLFVFVVALLCLWKTTSPARRWQFGLFLTWLFNLFEFFSNSADWIVIARNQPVFSCVVTHLIPTLFIGLGLMHVVAYCAKPRLNEQAKQIPERPTV